ncbi:MAG: TerC family protein, partial [Crocinitomicaceae bacterium]
MIDFFKVLFHFEGWLYLFLLSVLEIVLGIDNIIFISIVTDKLSVKTKRKKARTLGLAMALIIRFILLGLLSLLVHLVDPIYEPWFGTFNYEDLVLLVGGVFLIYKSTVEMRHSMVTEETDKKSGELSFRSVVTQIVLVDLVFSFDSVISAIGMTNGLEDQL